MSMYGALWVVAIVSGFCGSYARTAPLTIRQGIAVALDESDHGLHWLYASGTLTY